MPPSGRRGRARGTRSSVNAGPLDVSVSDDREALQALGRALKQEADGKALRRDLNRGLKSAMQPIRDDAHSNLLSISSAGLSRGQGLRQAVAKQMKVQASTSGRRAGVKLRVRRKGMPRGFENAPKALNNPKGWRHPVFGDTDTWVDQRAQPIEWFDSAHRDRANRQRVREAVVAAMNDVAARITRKV